MQSARQQLETAKSQANSARAAEQRYNAAYSSVVSLGKAVPPSEEVPSLIYQLELASDQRDIEFTSITSGGCVGSSSSASASAAAATLRRLRRPSRRCRSRSSSKAASRGWRTCSGRSTASRERNTAGHLAVSGRLLTIQGADIAVESSGSSGSSSSALTATITATAYVLPASQGLTGGATALGPSATTISAAGSSATPSTPAVVKATP